MRQQDTNQRVASTELAECAPRELDGGLASCRKFGCAIHTGAMNWAWCWLALASLACAESPARVRREIFGTRSFAISNSPMLVQQRQPRVDHGRVSVTYSFLIESFANYQQSVALGSARAEIAGRRPKVVCKVGDYALAELLLEAHGRYRIDCELGFTLQEVPLGQMGDSTANITIPMTLDGVSGEMTFSYYFRREDAS